MVKILAGLLFPFLFHPVHVSMSSLADNPGENEYVLTVRMYNDDLATDLYVNYNVKEVTVVDHLVKYTGPDENLVKYINDNLKVYFNGKRADAILKNKEVQELETIFTLDIDAPKKVKKVEIENTILTGLYGDQVNLFIFKNNTAEEAVKFTSDYTSKMIELK